MLTLVLLVLIGLFLVLQSGPALAQEGFRFFTTRVWQPDGTRHQFGIAAVRHHAPLDKYVLSLVILYVRIARHAEANGFSA